MSVFPSDNLAVIVLHEELQRHRQHIAKLERAIAILEGADEPPERPQAAPKAASANGSRSNGSRPLLSEAVLAYVQAHPSDGLTLADVSAAMAAKGFKSKNSVRQVLYGLRDRGIIRAERGATNWDQTKYYAKSSGSGSRGGES